MNLIAQWSTEEWRPRSKDKARHVDDSAFQQKNLGPLSPGQHARVWFMVHAKDADRGSSVTTAERTTQRRTDKSLVKSNDWFRFPAALRSVPSFPTRVVAKTVPLDKRC